MPGVAHSTSRLIAAALLSAALMASAPGCADAILLYPSTRPVDAHGATRHELPYGDGHLELFTARSPGCASTRPAVVDLELVGNGSRAEWAARTAAQRWGDRPVEVWALNWPGYGRSTGPARLAAIAPAALAAFDAVHATAAGRPVVIFGHSLGTTAALSVAARRPGVAGLVLLNPPPLPQLIVGHYGWWNLWVAAAIVAAQVPPDLDSLANASQVTAPAVFVSGSRDTVVPPAYHRRVFDAYAGPKRLVIEPTADHDAFPDPATDPAFRHELDWLFGAIQPTTQSLRPG